MADNEALHKKKTQRRMEEKQAAVLEAQQKIADHVQKTFRAIAKKAPSLGAQAHFQAATTQSQGQGHLHIIDESLQENVFLRSRDRMTPVQQFTQGQTITGLKIEKQRQQMRSKLAQGLTNIGPAIQNLQSPHQVQIGTPQKRSQQSLQHQITGGRLRSAALQAQTQRQMTVQPPISMSGVYQLQEQIPGLKSQIGVQSQQQMAGGAQQVVTFNPKISQRTTPTQAANMNRNFQSYLVTGSSKQESPSRQGAGGLIQLQNIEPFILSDLSSINALLDDEIVEQEALSFKPQIGAPCSNSIFVCDNILSQMIDRVIRDDEVFEAMARLRAIRLCISTAWTGAFNNQFFIDKKLHESMTPEMIIDCTEIEDDEPKAAPIDNFAKSGKVKIRYKEPKPKIKVKKTSPKRLKITPLRHRMRTEDQFWLQIAAKSPKQLMPFKSQLQKNFTSYEERVPASERKGGNKQRLYKANSVMVDASTLDCLNTFRVKNKRKGSLHGSNSNGSSCSNRSKSANRSQYTQRKRNRARSSIHNRDFTKKTEKKPDEPQPIALRDYYSDFDDNSSHLEDSHSDESKALIVKKKQSKRTVVKLKDTIHSVITQDMYGQKSAREKHGLTQSMVQQLKKLTPLDKLVTDSSAQILPKKTDTHIENDLVMIEARQKRDQVVFQTQGQTYVTEEAPGLQVHKCQNKRYRRIVIRKKEPEKTKTNWLAKPTQTVPTVTEFNPNTQPSYMNTLETEPSKTLAQNSQLSPVRVNHIGVKQLSRTSDAQSKLAQFPNKKHETISVLKTNSVQRKSSQNKLLMTPGSNATAQQTQNRQKETMQQLNKSKVGVSVNQSRATTSDQETSMRTEKDSEIIGSKLSQVLKEAILKKMGQHQFEERDSNEAEEPPKKTNLLSQLMRDAILSKLIKMEQKHNQKKAPLMPHRFRTRLANQKSLNMLSIPLDPYKIKYKKTLPLFKIDRENFQLYQNQDMSERQLEKIMMQIEQDSNNLSPTRHSRNRSEDQRMMNKLPKYAMESEPREPHQSKQKESSAKRSVVKCSTADDFMLPIQELTKPANEDDHVKYGGTLVPKDMNRLNLIKNPPPQQQWHSRKTAALVPKNQLSTIHQPVDESARQSPLKPYELLSRDNQSRHPLSVAQRITSPLDSVQNEQAFLPEIDTASRTMQAQSTHQKQKARIKARTTVKVHRKLDNRRDRLMQSQPNLNLKQLLVGGPAKPINLGVLTSDGMLIKDDDRDVAELKIQLEHAFSQPNLREKGDLISPFTLSSRHQISTQVATSSQLSARKPPTQSRANLIKALEKPKSQTKFTSKVEIKNLQLARKMQHQLGNTDLDDQMGSVGLDQPRYVSNYATTRLMPIQVGQSTRATHGLMNVDWRSTIGSE